MFISLPSITITGLETQKVDIEINIFKRGMPGFEIIGLPNKSIVESRYRIKTAILNSGFEFPLKKIIVNLAPADLPKEGSFYDLAIAVGILSAITTTQIPEDSLFFGEVSLDGALRHTRGAFLFSLFATEAGYKRIFIPNSNVAEACGVNYRSHKLDIIGVDNLKSLIFQMEKKTFCVNHQPTIISKRTDKDTSEQNMSSIYGQARVKRALEISSAGGHNIFISGPPGSGKSLLAKSFTTILPRLTDEQVLEVTKIYSLSGKITSNAPFITQPPFRAPHSSISIAGMLGGGIGILPGEITLAHNGVLFMDEFPEFSGHVLESLRQPMEEKKIVLTRNGNTVVFPSNFILIACANPCPCGFYGSTKSCKCTPKQIELYKKRISGPILDRIDLFVRTNIINPQEIGLFEKTIIPENSESILNRVVRARELQISRFYKYGFILNSQITADTLGYFCNISNKGQAFLAGAMAKFGFSMRVYFKLLKLSRTIADLANSNDIHIEHLAEALSYRTQYIENI